MAQLGQFLKEVLRDYGKRFWIFWPILYVTVVLEELSSQIFLENSNSIVFAGLAPQIYYNRLFVELLGRPYLALPLISAFVLSVWGFSSLYFSFRDSDFWGSLNNGLKNLHRYLSFIIIASLITLAGFVFLPGIAILLLDTFTDIPLYLSDGETLNLWLALPLALILGIPGIYLLIAFSNAPFILLLERKNIVQSLRESIRRVTPRWFMAAIYLLISFSIAAVAYFALSWLIFTLKLALIPDMSLRGESMLRVFIYSISWIVAASFYDLAVYHLYQRFAAVLPAHPKEESEKNNKERASFKNPFNYFSPLKLRAISVFLLIAFIAVFVLFPVQAHAGSTPRKILQPIKLLLRVASFFDPTGITLIVNFVIQAAEVATCKGKYDPIFGTCTVKKRESAGSTQEVRCSTSAKFTKIDLPDIPTPSEFAVNPNSSAPVVFNWQANAQPGLVNYFTVRDTATNKLMTNTTFVSGTISNICSSGPQINVNNLEFEKEYQAQIWFASCFQSGAKSVTPTCSGCGGDVACINTKITTPSLPIPRVDIKADGKDGNVTFKAGVPVKLSWTSEYALSCEAQGGWSGGKGTSGTQTVTPSTGSEVYTLVCKRGEKSGSDSVSSAPATKQIQIYDSQSGGGGGGVGSLRIDSFNITDPLNPGDTVTISWSVSGAEFCEVKAGDNTLDIPTMGNVDITFLRTITATLACKDKEGKTVSATKTIEVKKIPRLKEIKPE